MVNTKPGTLSRTWFALAALLTALELVFLYEAMFADMAGYERIFGVFAGLATLSFAALLYSVKVVLYD
jgi:hypothetical protein